jgi:hypothetical protein
VFIAVGCCAANPACSGSEFRQIGCHIADEKAEEETEKSCLTWRELMSFGSSDMEHIFL